MSLPKAIKIDTTRRNMSGGYAIQYECRNCKTTVPEFLYNPNYCPHCGESLYWGVLKYTSKHQADVLQELHENDANFYKIGLLRQINLYNEYNNLSDKEDWAIEEETKL